VYWCISYWLFAPAARDLLGLRLCVIGSAWLSVIGGLRLRGVLSQSTIATYALDDTYHQGGAA